MMPDPKALQQAAVPLKVIDVVDHALKTRGRKLHGLSRNSEITLLISQE